MASCCSRVGRQDSDTAADLLLLERGPLVAAHRPEGAVRVARVGVHVEAAGARALDERDDPCRDGLELRALEGADRRPLAGEEEQIAALDVHLGTGITEGGEGEKEIDRDLERGLPELARG